MGKGYRTSDKTSKLAPHTHPAIEHVTVLSGTFHIAPGESFDQSKGKRLPVGASS